MGKFFRKLWVIKTDDCERNDPSSQNLRDDIYPV